MHLYIIIIGIKLRTQTSDQSQ